MLFLELPRPRQSVWRHHRYSPAASQVSEARAGCRLVSPCMRSRQASWQVPVSCCTRVGNGCVVSLHAWLRYDSGTTETSLMHPLDVLKTRWSGSNPASLPTTMLSWYHYTFLCLCSCTCTPLQVPDTARTRWPTALQVLHGLHQENGQKWRVMPTMHCLWAGVHYNINCCTLYS